MNTLTPSRSQLIEVINKLPLAVLPELASFLNYLQFKAETPPQPEQTVSGSEFLLSIAGIGTGEAELSERDEEVLAEEIDPVRGWSFSREAQP
ncbi:MAG: hypothetical protein R3A44_45145 [Caldilineaceae bacterium]